MGARWERAEKELSLYDQVQMRRFVSILFLLLCGLGPLSALLPGNGESQLPACCRRHGVHRCTMEAEQASVSGHALAAPAHCPQYHRGSPATTGAFTPSAGLGMARLFEASAGIAGVRIIPLHRASTSANRGPPPVLL